MGSSRPLNILILSTFDGANANVIRDFLFSFQAFSRHRCFYVFDCRTIDERFDFTSFDVILVFWSVYLPNDELAPAVLDRIREARAVKALFLQDEYRDVRMINAYMARMGVQHMFSCVDPADQEVFYPRALVPSLDAVHHVLTGYVPSYLKRYAFDPDGPRRIDIAYRSRDVPAYLGDLGRQKFLIAERFGRIAEEHGFTSDISVREEDRIYGRAWVRFIRDCRFSIGTPSGASVVDFDGTIRARCIAELAEHPDATYEDLRAKYFADVDEKVVISTISPRIFEAATLGSVLVMLEGSYAGVIEPGRHFLELRRDDSNVLEVVDQMRDRTLCHRIARQAYEDLVLSGRYSYETMVARFDHIVEEAVGPVPVVPAISRMSYVWSRYWASDQRFVPFRQGFLTIHSLRHARRAVAHRLLGPASRWQTTLTAAPGLPDALFKKLRVGLRPIFRCRGLRRIVLRGLLPGTAVSLRQLLRDTYRLEILHRIARGDIRTQSDFAVDVVLEEEPGRLVLRSRSIGDDVAARADRGGAPHAAIDRLRHGAVREIIWDHSAVGRTVSFALAGHRVSIYMGGTGRHRFEGLGRLATTDPTVVADLLVATVLPTTTAGHQAAASTATDADAPPAPPPGKPATASRTAD